MSTPFEPLTAHEKAEVVRALGSVDNFPSYIANPEWGATSLASRVASPLSVPDLTW